jgi:microcystin-dependent protein
MATNFPASLDSLANPTSSNTLNSPSHSSQHANINDAMEAVQAKVGVDNSATTTSLDYKMRINNPVGEITMWSTASAPTGWLICDGTAVNRTTYAALFAVVGTTYGAGDGSTTFNLPNLVGRVPTGRNASDVSFDVLGEQGGAKTNALGSSNLPAHSHTPSESPHDHSLTNDTLVVRQDGGGNALLLAGSQGLATYGPYNTYTIDSQPQSTGLTVGGGGNGTATGDAFSVLQPYTVVNFIIRH